VGVCYFVAAQHVAPVSQQLLTCFSFLGVAPQHALTSSQHAAPVLQHSCTAEQQPASLAQHFMPLSQQPNLAGAAQHALLAEQHANFALQQSVVSGFTSAAPEPANTTPKDRTTAVRMFFNMECLQ